MEKTTSPAADRAPPAPVSSTARTIRETVESIVIAFVLAFLFRTFEAEAFVIPTGSMAPTLQGRHKDVVCPECEYQFRVGAQGEREERNPQLRMTSAICPMCRYELDLEALIPKEPRTYQTFEGDRILVNKFSYDMSDPERWDVVVFKYPEDAKTNYIKRLVGLPGEHVFIGDPGRGHRVPPSGTGDIYISTDGDKTRRVARKDKPDKLVAVLQDVHDNDYVPTRLLEAGWPSRWQNEPAGADGWVEEDGTRAFATAGKRAGEVWLRYHHLLPRHVSPEAPSWIDVERTRYDSYLIRDFYAYNTGEYPNHRVGHGENWVGDLALECEVEIRSDDGELILELVKGGRKFQARIDVANGDARLVIPGVDNYKPVAKNVINGAGTYEFRFVNVDEQLWLFVDDEPVEFDAATTYDSLGNYEPVTDRRLSAVGATDLSPAGIASEGVDLRVSHLRIKRDVFYTRGEQDDAIDDIALADKENNEEDQFFMLGDNSPASKDGRMWGPVDYVERRLLIGKAIYIYWPHGIPASFSFPVNIFGSKKYIPFWPNLGRMERVR
jgi:signal peptidase I